MNLYSYVRNNPLTQSDLYGLSTLRLTPILLGPYIPFESDYSLMDQSIEFVTDLLNTPAFQGSMQVFGGLMEMGTGAATALSSYGIGSFVGFPIIAHGIDQFTAGCNTIFYQESQRTVTSQMLEFSGLSLDVSDFIDSGLSILGTAGGNAFTKAAKSTSFVTVNRPASSSVSAQLLKNKLIAQEISGGHAFKKHVLKQKEFPGFSQYKFQQHINNILDNPTEMKLLLRGRSAYWDQKTGTVVVRDPLQKDGGTAFKPLIGKIYYDDILK